MPPGRTRSCHVCLCVQNEIGFRGRLAVAFHATDIPLFYFAVTGVARERPIGSTPALDAAVEGHAQPAPTLLAAPLQGSCSRSEDAVTNHDLAASRNACTGMSRAKRSGCSVMIQWPQSSYRVVRRPRLPPDLSVDQTSEVDAERRTGEGGSGRGVGTNHGGNQETAIKT
jgi:hypothetical protein